MSETKDCDHVWKFQMVVYWTGEKLPGSGACHVWYGDKFFCEKCLETKVINNRIEGNDYHKPISGTFPR